MQKLGAHVAAIGFTFYTDQHVVGLPEQHGGRGGAPVVGQTALRSFDLKSGAAKGTYPFPTNGGVCNDMA